ncbi:hypothetical protein FN846DRAFT_902326 [Sphaerosporella brunnea]|uniref:Uncharacterized protein n=1 Tax=Sphaerosporella brunnea TaxID=1250544 RepID=A0A5J5FA11_9PEZI|nr:hypothetical protein FN846DRAFT_902326 [Sphaerosporella brunnea]
MELILDACYNCTLGASDWDGDGEDDGREWLTKRLMQHTAVSSLQASRFLIANINRSTAFFGGVLDRLPKRAELFGVLAGLALALPAGALGTVRIFSHTQGALQRRRPDTPGPGSGS